MNLITVEPQKIGGKIWLLLLNTLYLRINNAK